MSFNKLKKARADSISKLVAAAEKVGGGTEKKSYGDDRQWKPTVDKSGNGYAVLRFLPAPEGDDLPWVRYWDHGFQGPTGRWYIEKSLTSIGKDDPVSEMNSILWNSGDEKDKEIARSRKRRLHYVSNILVVSDPGNPDNEGKTFLYQYGKKIFDKIMDVMQPQFQDEEPVNPFDFWGGASFKLKIRNFEGYRNYDKSEFETASELFDGDEARLEEIYNRLYSLKEFTDESSYKSYAELKTKLNMVLGEDAIETTVLPVAESSHASLTKSEPAAEPDQEEEPSLTQESASEDSEDSDSLSYFAKLASQ